MTLTPEKWEHDLLNISWMMDIINWDRREDGNISVSSKKNVSMHLK